MHVLATQSFEDVQQPLDVKLDSTKLLVLLVCRIDDFVCNKHSEGPGEPSKLVLY